MAQSPHRPLLLSGWRHRVVVAVQANDTRVEVGLIGYEGMTGTSILLGSDRTPHSTYVQAAGEGQRDTMPSRPSL